MSAVDKNDYQTLFERARVILDTQPEVETYQQLADALGVRRNTLYSGFRRHFNIKTFADLKKPGAGGNPQQESAEYIEDDQYINIICASKRIRTVQDAIKEFKIDLTQWRVDRFKVKTSEGYRKDRQVEWEVENGFTKKGIVHDSGKMLIAPMYHVQVTLVRRTEEIRARNVVAEFIADAKKHAPKYPVLKYKPKRGLVYEVDLPDIHFGKFTWREESGDDYDIKIARELVLKTMNRLLSYSQNFGVERILLPMGNDFFNVDNKENTTTHGTPQQEDTRWQKTFMEGKRLAVDMIDMCLSLAPVDVVVIPGNHDEQRAFYLGAVLEAHYSKCKTVTVDNSAKKRKYRHFGKILLGFTHGYHEKLQKLPSIMPIEAPEEWARSMYREWHLGDKHHKKDLLHRTEDVDGVTIRLLRSLSATDVWHFDKGYVGTPRTAEAFLWDKNDGLMAQFQAGIEK